jgi:hypothetical protein
MDMKTARELQENCKRTAREQQVLENWHERFGNTNVTDITEKGDNLTP